MKIRFLGQGLFPDSEQPIGDGLFGSHVDYDFNKLTCIVAFASPGGVLALGKYLNQAKAHLKQIDVYVGIDLHGTSKEALDELLKLNVGSYIFYTTSPMVFHPKIYLFEGDHQCRVVLGSSNLTTSGLFSSAESVVFVDFDKSDQEGNQLLAEIRHYYRDLLSGKDPNLATLDGALIEKLVKLKLVLSDVERRKAQEKGEEAGDAGTEGSGDEAAKLFPPRKLGRVPAFAKGRASGASSKPEKKGEKPSLGGQGPTFWIQTGALTGGSGNQIDLSMSGPHGSKGSVSLFGIDPDKTAIVKSIALKYEGETYFGNTIKFPLNSTGKTNGTWRIQLHGVASNGDKLTQICSDCFRHTIIVFHKIGSDAYEITLVKESELENMKKKSVFWDQNSSSIGKHFGKIQ